jgi:gliding motility-associated-like protein
MLLPTDTYGYTYYSINYQQPAVGGAPGKNWFFVIASEDNTRIEITPADTTQTGKLPGQTFTVNLNKGELYNVFGLIGADGVSKDITGSKAVSVIGADGQCHPITMFSGCSRFLVCPTDGGEVAQQQIFPLSAWGTRYLTYHSFNVALNPLTTPMLNFYRVIVSDPTTIVTKNGVPLTGLVKNFYYEYSSTSGDYIESDKPIMLCQYTPNSNECSGNSMSPQGDPELIFLPSIEQGIKSARVYNTRNNNITLNYLTVIIPTAGLSSLKIDGAAVPASQRITHPANSAYTVIAKRLLGPGTQHTIISDSAFSAIIYGTGVFESYGYIAGTLINNLNSVGSIQNLYNNTSLKDTFTCPQSPFVLTAQIAYRVSSLQWLLSQVNGLSPAADTTLLNPVPADSVYIGGRKYFTYQLPVNLTLNDTGTKYIPIIYSSPQIDHCSQQDEQTLTVVVKKGPVADFNIQYAACPYDTALLTALPDVNGYTLYNYQWQFTDTLISQTDSVYKQFATGIHPVTLTATATNGCMADTVKSIATNPLPASAFGYQQNICMGDSVLLTDSSNISAGTITQWHWNFGNGHDTIVYAPAPLQQAYTATGLYQIQLFTVSAAGCKSDIASKLLSVTAKPSGLITYTGAPCADSVIRFTAAITNNGNTVQALYWNFGDGQTTTSGPGSINHTYSITGNNIPVKMVVLTGGCNSDTIGIQIPFIKAAPVASFNVVAAANCIDKNIQFVYNGNTPVQTYQWNFGDGRSSNLAQPTNRYVAAGTYTTSLTITSTDGCGSAASTQPVIIYPSPVIDAGPTLYTVTNQPVQLQTSMTDTIGYSFEWTPASTLNNSKLYQPVSTAATDILYTVKVIGGPGNCDASDTVSVLILRQWYIPSAFTPDNNGLNDYWTIPGISNNPAARVIIYNRYGQKIFESAGYRTPWDGTYNGTKQPAGAYTYIIQPDTSKTDVIKGMVLIIR